MFDTDTREELWSEILPGLYQGGTADYDQLGQRLRAPMITPAEFDTVVTLFAQAVPVDWYVKEIRLGFFDHDEVDLDEHDLAHAVRIAFRDWKRGKRVLIRCQAGWNRSGLVTALVLLLDGQSPEEAISLIREKRSDYALCNDYFEHWIRTNGESFVSRIALSPSYLALKAQS